MRIGKLTNVTNISIPLTWKTIPWIDDEEVDPYIASDDPEKVRAAVLLIGTYEDEAMLFGIRGGTLHHFGLPVLDKLARSHGGLSEDVQQAFLNITFRCDCFSPDLTDDNKVGLSVALVLRTGSSYAAMQVAMQVKITKPVEPAVAMLVKETGQQLLNTSDTPEAKEGAEWLLDWLLDGSKKVRAATLENVGRWPDTPLHQSVIQAEWERLTTKEQQHLHEIQQAQKVRQTSWP